MAIIQAEIENYRTKGVLKARSENSGLGKANC